MVETRLATYTADNGDQVVVDEFQDCVAVYYCRDGEKNGHVWLFNTASFVPGKYQQPPYPLEPEMIRSHDIELPLEASDFRALFNAERGTVGITFEKS